MKNRAVLYTRVSTNKKEQEKSLEIQEKQYEEYCERKGYELMGIYKDVGSGTSVRERPGFIQMMLDAGLDHEENNNATDIFRTNDNKKPKFDLIIVKDASRFSRNTEIGISTVNRLKDKEVAVLFENADLKSTDASAKQLMQTLFSIAEIESENMSKRIKFSKKYNSVNKIYSPARLPYGYERNEKNEIVVNQEQRKTVEFIFNNYPKQGSHILTQRLNEKNVPTQQGNKWSNYKITRIISNLIYTGTAVVNRSSKKNVTDTKRYDIPEEEWIKIPNAVDPIIELEQWEEANRIRESRINKSTKKGRKPSVNDIYHEKLYCQNCGSRFVRHMGVKDKITYICQNRRKAQGCTVRGISISNVNEVFDRVNPSTQFDDMGNYIYYKELMKAIESESHILVQRKAMLIAKIESLETENAMVRDELRGKLRKASQTTVDSYLKDVEINEKIISELNTQLGKVNINSIHYIRRKVEDKKTLIEEIKKTKRINKNEKLKLLKKITVGDYVCEVAFSLPSYEEEIVQFNEIFNEAAIALKNGFHQFTETIRRDHKQAREYWANVDWNSKESEEYFRENKTRQPGDYTIRYVQSKKESMIRIKYRINNNNKFRKLRGALSKKYSSMFISD